MRMKVLFSGQVPKEPAFPDDMEDMVVIAADDCKVVISDGASESFDSRTWARLLASSFIERFDLNTHWLDSVIAEYVVCFDFAALSWSKQAAFARGSFATLLAVRDANDDDTVTVISVGDSLAVFLDGDQLLESFRYTHVEDFQQHPALLCSNTLSNTFLSSAEELNRLQTTWCLKGRSNPVILCMTDALGEWALRHHQDGNPKWETLAKIRDVTELEGLVLQERATKNLRVDDVTLVTLAFLKSENDELPES